MIRDGVLIGRNPWPGTPDGVAAAIDLCAELPGWAGARAFPMLDLVAPPPERLAAAAAAIEQARPDGPVLVYCALGYGRSAAAVAAWLVATGRATSLAAAIAEIAGARPRVVFDAATRSAITAAVGFLR
jgi:protein-tyrosine phosphatase